MPPCLPPRCARWWTPTNTAGARSCCTTVSLEYRDGLLVRGSTRGDGFVGGLLYGLLRGWPAEDCLHFGWATGAMATTMLEDFATPADEDQVWSVWKGNARVKR